MRGFWHDVAELVEVALRYVWGQARLRAAIRWGKDPWGVYQTQTRAWTSRPPTKSGFTGPILDFLARERRIQALCLFRKAGLPANIVVILRSELHFLSVRTVVEALLEAKTRVLFVKACALAEGFESEWTARGVRIEAEDFDVSSFEPDVVFLPTPFDEILPPSLRSASLMRIARLAYVPYGFEIGAWHRNQFDAFLHNNAWRVFARSERFAGMYRRYSSRSRGENVRVTGHPKSDLLWRAQAAATRPAGDRRRILWTPHFDELADGTGWSTFSVFLETFLSFTRTHREVDFVVRPHPYLKGRLAELGRAEQWERLEAADREFSHFTLHTEPEYFDLLTRIDALMSDCSSLLFEFLPMGRPVLYLENPRGPRLNEEGDVVKLYEIAREPSGMEAFLRAFADASLPKTRVGNDGAVEEFLYRFDGNCGRRVAEGILRDLGADLPASR